MNIDAISSFINQPEIQRANQNKSPNVDFSDYLKNALDKVNDSQINAENTTMDFITGKSQDIHQVMLASEEAKISLELAVQVRNKLVDAYQEIMRMQL